MNQAQRIVVVIALGVGLFAVAGALNLLLLDPVEPGWFSYEPSVGVTTSESDSYIVVGSDRTVLEQAVVWLVALLTWTALSVRLLRTPPEDG